MGRGRLRQKGFRRRCANGRRGTIRPSRLKSPTATSDVIVSGATTRSLATKAASDTALQQHRRRLLEGYFVSGTPRKSWELRATPSLIA